MTLEQSLNDIKNYISLKKETLTGDIVLVGMPNGFCYATVQDIRQDIKKNWYIVRLTLLVLPPVALEWTLRLPQMCGEIFTINNKEHFMAAVAFETGKNDNPSQGHTTDEKISHSGKVIQLIPRK